MTIPTAEERSRYRFWRRVFALVGLTFGCALIILLASIRNSDLYNEAVSRAFVNPAVNEVLGFPVNSSLMVRGGLQALGFTNHAELVIQISGPKADAEIVVVANKRADVWKFKALDVVVDEPYRRINLLR